MHLQEIKLQTNNLPSLFDFYKSLIGLPVIKLDNSISVVAGDSTLIFEESNAEEHAFYHFAFNIPSNKLDEAFDWAKKRVEIIWLEEYKSYIADFKSWNAKSFYFLDPAGNIGELIARYDQDDNAKENFNAHLFRNVSEIGLVFPSATFAADVSGLVNKFQLNYFPKQPPLEYFKAIGDDDGLFVSVPESRNWFSTKLPAGIFPLSVKFRDHGREHHLTM